MTIFGLVSPLEALACASPPAPSTHHSPLLAFQLQHRRLLLWGQLGEGIGGTGWLGGCEGLWSGPHRAALALQRWVLVGFHVVGHVLQAWGGNWHETLGEPQRGHRGWWWRNGT